jgi:uncharacterized protein (TIGR02466 family)|tara:strand:+ start:211 stop:828 length:618 start_codon:yes stop_codon:yes gene_type:complete
MIHSLFPTAVGIYDMQVPDNITEDYLRSLDISGYHGLVSNGESSHDTVKGEEYLLNYPGMEYIKDQIQQCINNYSAEVGLEPLALTGSWFNIMKSEGYVLPHHHRVSTVSGAFYVSSEPNTCPLFLKNPLDNTKMLDLPAIRNQYTSNTAQIDSIKGRLIIFPSYIEHYTEINQSEQSRIVISFNTLPISVINTIKKVDLVVAPL